jgi:hypothetical protein
VLRIDPQLRLRLNHRTAARCTAARCRFDRWRSLGPIAVRMGAHHG